MRRHSTASTAGSTKTRRAGLPLGVFAAILAALALIAALADAAVPTATTGSASSIEKTTATLNGTVNPEGALLEECKFEYGTTQSYGQTQACDLTPAQIGEGTAGVAVKAEISGLAEGTNYHFRLVAKNAEGTSNGADETFKTLGPPVVEAWSTDVVYSEATLNAAINPEGFATTYRFQWGPTAAYGSETAEADAGEDSAVHSFSQFLEGLAEGTTYHYRVIATNANGTSETPDHTFTTYAHEAPDTSCANLPNRYGAGADLPDCRAYEMVSPVDKNGGDIRTLANINGLRTAANQAAIDGDKFTYSSYKSFGDALGNLYSNQYIATRGAVGWTSHGISPLHHNYLYAMNAFSSVWDLEIQFKDFSDDLSQAWITDDANPPLTAQAVEGKVNLYRRNNEDDRYEALTTTEPTASSADLGYEMSVGGHSEDGALTAFSARGALTPDAAPTDKRQVYDSVNGQLHLVSVLPNGEPSSEDSYVGGPYPGDSGRIGAVEGAVSRDGSHIYWTMAAGGSGSRVGNLYVRIGDQNTLAVSEGGLSKFVTASPDGSKAIFTTGGLYETGEASERLYRFDLPTETTTEIADEVYGVLGASKDTSYVYFASAAVLAPGGVAGKPNVYVDHEGVKHFVGTLSKVDVGGGDFPGRYGITTPAPINRSSRVTLDGSRLIFQSNAELTGYDNRSASNGEPAIEIYMYDADRGQLHCISCNPSGARPTTRPLQRPDGAVAEPLVGNSQTTTLATAAWLSTAERETYYPRTLSDDGSRVFFNSFDALLPQDTNGQQDVYEWQESGTGGCADGEGCVRLVSSGKSPQNSEFVDANPSGRDVFFTTESSLLPQDPGLIDIYDAREGGGYPPPPPGPPACVGDACQSVPPTPGVAAPASAAFKGAGSPLRRMGDSCAKQGKRASLPLRKARKLRHAADRSRSVRRRSALRRHATRLTRKSRALRRASKRCRRANRRAAR